MASSAQPGEAAGVAGPIATVGELIERLKQLPPATQVLVNGYEGGYSGVASTAVVKVQELAGIATYMGRFATVADAALEVAGRGPSGAQYTLSRQAPTAVGEPLIAVVLQRE